MKKKQILPKHLTDVMMRFEQEYTLYLNKVSIFSISYKSWRMMLQPFLCVNLSPSYLFGLAALLVASGTPSPTSLQPQRSGKKLTAK